MFTTQPSYIIHISLYLPEQLCLFYSEVKFPTPSKLRLSEILIAPSKLKPGILVHFLLPLCYFRLTNL